MQVNSQRRENTQTTILALLLTHKAGCTLRQLDKDYYELEGEHIPWKDLGYVSLLGLLRNMSKAVQIENKNNVMIVKGIASDKSKHVSKLVAGQRDHKQPIGRKIYKPNHYYPKTAPPRIHISAEILSRIVSLINYHPDGLHKDYVLDQVQSYMPFVNINMKDMEEQLQELSHKIFQTNNKIYPVSSKDNTFYNFPKSDGISRSEYAVCNDQKWKSSIVTVAGDEESNDMLNYNEEDSFEFSPHSNVSKSLNAQSNTRTKSTSSFIKKTVSKCQDEPLESKLMTQINQDESRSLFLSNYTASDQITMECNNSTKEEEENYLENKDVEILISDRVKFRLEKLIQNHPEGIWCADLPEKYLEEYKVPLNYAELGFNSVREFAAQLPQIFHCIQPYDTGDFRLHYAKEEIPSNRLKQKKKSLDLTHVYHIYETNNEEALPAEVSLNTCRGLIPDEVMTIGECVGNLNVEDFMQGEEPYVEVLVVEVFTPSFFWIQFRKKQKLFNRFMDDLHNFYAMKYEQYVIPPVVLERGLNCACIYNGTWHRGIIKTVKPDFHVTVMFYDYGTLKTYSPESVYYLHRTFSCLPAQAIPCGLVNVRPCKGSKWSRSATHHFAVRTSQIPLVATIASINTEDNSIMITLTDTLEEEDVHINDWLVEQKLGEHGKMVCMKKRNFPFQYYLECRERFKHKFEILKYDKLERDLKNEAALYNLNSTVGLFCKNISNETQGDKINSCNEDGEKLQLLKSNDFHENDNSIEETRSSTRNFNGKAPKKLLSLYEKLLSLKQKSTQPVKINDIENNNNIYTRSENEKFDCISASKRSTNQKPYEDTVILCRDTKRDTSSDKLILANYKKNNSLSDDDYDILERHNNIPVQYANHFDIQDPENELDINYMRKFVNKCNQDLIEYADSSEIWKTAIRIKESISVRNEIKIPHDTIFKSRDNMPLAENCFSTAVCNSSYNTDRDEEICWSPTGNINKIYDVSPLILKDIGKHMRSMTKNMTIAIPQKILEMLTEGKYFEERSNIVNSISETQCASSLQKVSTVDIDNLEDNKDDILLNKNFDDYSNDCNKNDYFSMKTIVSRKKLLEKLLSIKNTSSNTSDLDSDDLSTSEGSVLSQYNINRNEEKTEEKYKDNVNVCGDKSSESCAGTSSECSSHSVQSDKVDLYAREGDQISNHDLSENEITVTSPITPVLTKNTELVDEILIDSILTQPLIGQSDSANHSNNSKEQLLLNGLLLKEEIEEPLDALMAEESLSVGETIHSQVVPLNRDYIPVFNDNEINSDDEEWDAQVSHADLISFHKGICSINKNIEDRNDLDSRLNIVEIDSNSLADANDIEIYESANDDSNKIMHSDSIVDRYIHSDSNESTNLTNRHEESETQVSPTNSKKSLEIDNEYISNAVNTTPVSHKLQGKAKTLVEMLNKVKLL